MGRPCTICAAGVAGEVTAMLEEGRSVAFVARELAVSEDALGRHVRSHRGRGSRTRAVAPSDRQPSDPLDELVDALRDRALAGDAALAREYRLALAALEARRAAALVVTAYVDTPEWIGLRTRLLAALEPFPDARRAVADALA